MQASAHRLLLLLATISSIIVGTLRYRAWMIRDSRPADSDAPPEDEFFTVPWITVVPAESMVYPWTFFTSTFVEQNIFTLMLGLGTIFYGGRYLERAWGTKEFVKFVLVVSVLPNVVAFVIYNVWFALGGNVERIFSTICGGFALQAGFLVAFKQLVPEHTITILKGVLKIRVKHFPALFLFLNVLSGPIFGTDVSAILTILGFLISWTYLRFYKRSYPDLGTNQAPSLKGDASEIFAIAYFFPDPIHRPIAIISNIIWNIMVACRICTPFSAADISASNKQPRESGDISYIFGSSQNNRGGSGRAEAERRRALALKALDQQLHAAASNKTATTSGPNVLGETSLDTREA
ncbi:eukaryotic integral membrane protein-domain-containing protein [Pyronema omphalodes]|nr:eukaryotic integral membrane protein-domain-containing protein [Pyronema omphalodes]